MKTITNHQIMKNVPPPPDLYILGDCPPPPEMCSVLPSPDLFTDLNLLHCFEEEESSLDFCQIRQKESPSVSDLFLVASIP